jgi:hypothetical protein
MRSAALVLALFAPLPVTSVIAFGNQDGSVTVSWVLPDDSAVVGVTVIRQRLDILEPDVVFDLGLDPFFTDFSTIGGATYRYGIFTVTALGERSDGVFVEVVAPLPVVFVDTTASGSVWVCGVSATGPPSLWGVVLAASLLMLLRRPKMGRGPARSRRPPAKYFPRESPCGDPRGSRRE